MVMRDIPLRFCFLVTLALTALLITLTAIPSRAGLADDDLVRVKAKKAKDLVRQYDAAKTAEDKCVVFAIDGDDFYRPYRVISLCVTDKNKVYPAKVFIEETYSKPVGVAAVGQKDSPAGSPKPSAASAGLVFILDYYDSWHNSLLLQMAKFDAKGKKIGPLVEFPRILAPSDREFRGPNIVAAKGKNSVGIAVAVSVVDDQDNVESAKVYFLETDFDGKLIRGPAELTLPDNGQLQAVMLGEPRLDGKWWRLPASTINHKSSGASPSYNPISGHSLLILSAKPKAKGYKSKAVKVEADSQEYDDYTFAGIQFLPPTTGGGVTDPQTGSELNLFYQFKQLKTDPDDPLIYDIDYFIQGTKQGRPQGGPVEVQIADWEPGLQPNEDEWKYSMELLTNVAADGQGGFIVGINRSLNIGTYSTPGEAIGNWEDTTRWVDQLSRHRFYLNGQVDKSEYIWTGLNFGSFRTTWHLSNVYNFNAYNHIFTSAGAGDNPSNHLIALLTDVTSDTGDPLSSDVGIWKIPD
jgi:hypothetical protein